MKITVLGSGVIGVTSAYYLAKLGHEVTVIDRQSGPGMETSFANAGEISPGYASPWAAPGLPLKAFKWLWRDHSPLIIQPRIDLAALFWMARLLRNCTEARYDVNKRRMLKLSEFSRARLADLRTETGIRYDERMMGTLQVFRDKREFDRLAKDVVFLQAEGAPFEILDNEGCLRCEPGLAYASVDIAGGLRFPADETGDCFAFTLALSQMARMHGVIFQCDTVIRNLCTSGGIIDRVVTNKGDFTSDAFVVAMGSYSPLILRPMGLELPVYPVKGYSLTIPIVDEARAPTSTLMDEAHKVAITRLGNRIRVGGMAEICGFSSSLPQARRQTLEHSVGSLFPGGGDSDNASYWSGLRPMTPDGTPIIGRTAFRNLYLNTGHGTLGWTMACGSASILADIITGQRPMIDVEDYALSRYHC
jgi:D-amino-acid dehydrogenase